jgi:uncharacterized protein DUF3373
MRKLICGLTVVMMIAVSALWAQETATTSASNNSARVSPEKDTPVQLQQEIDQLKKLIGDLEQRLAAQEKHTQTAAQEKDAQAQAEKGKSDTAELKATVQELDKRVSKAEVGQAQDRLRFTGDYRFEAHSIWGEVPAHFDGMSVQNLVVKTMFVTPILGRMPTSVDEINKTAAKYPAEYAQFTSNLTYAQLQKAMASFPPAMQQQLFGMLLPSTYVPSYKDNNKVLYTNRLRLKFDAQVAENVSFTGRLSMYKVFGDSTGVQVFNGQPTSLNTDGTTASVPNSDQIRVERAYFSWNKIGGSKFYVSVGRRPSTYGPPLTYRQDEPRGGTPSGALIDYQFDGITVGYNLTDNMVWRICYGLGYESGFGNGNVLKLPQDRLKDTHFLGANLDLWNSERMLVQATYAHAFDVTDGFNGLVVLPKDPLTGEPIQAPVILRYTPSANLGAINLFGVNVTRRTGPLDLYLSGNYSGTRPNGQSTPFGGLMSDPFETPVDRNGYMGMVGVRFNFPNDERTKLGFEYNHGSKYWFNFAQAEDDLVAPKTNTRGNVYEAYLTHRISDRFIFKADYINYDYAYSGSGWHLGAPKRLDANPILGFPAYDGAFKFALALIARF